MRGKLINLEDSPLSIENCLASQPRLVKKKKPLTDIRESQGNFLLKQKTANYKKALYKLKLKNIFYH